MTDHTSVDAAIKDGMRYVSLDDGHTALVDIDPVFAVFSHERLIGHLPRFVRGFLHWNWVEVVFVPYSDLELSMPINLVWLGGVESAAKERLNEQLLAALHEATNFLKDPRWTRKPEGVRASLFASMAVLHEMVDEAHSKLTANPSIGRANPRDLADFLFSLLSIEVLLRILIARCGVERDDALFRFVHCATRNVEVRREFLRLLGTSTGGAQ